MKTIKEISCRRKNIFIACSLIFFLVVFWFLFVTSEYKTSAMVMLEIKENLSDVASVRTERPSLQNYIPYIRTHIEMLKSDPVLEKVARRVELAGLLHPQADEREIDIRQTVDFISRKCIEVEQIPFTNLVRINVRFKTAVKAAEIANTLIDVYSRWNNEFQNKEIIEVTRNLEKEKDELKDKLFQAEETLREFKRKNQIVAIDEEIKASLDRFYEIELEYAKSKMHEEELALTKKKIFTQLSEQEKLILSAVEIAENPIIQAKKIKLMDLEIELCKLLRDFSETSPQAENIRERIKIVENSFRKEAVRIAKSEISTLNPAYQEMAKQQMQTDIDLSVAYLRVESLSLLMKEYSSRAKQLSEDSLVLNRITRQIRINETMYMDILNKYNSMRLLKNRKEFFNIKLVSPAAIPLRKSRPLELTILLAMLISLFFSGLVASIYGYYSAHISKER